MVANVVRWWKEPTEQRQPNRPRYAVMAQFRTAVAELADAKGLKLGEDELEARAARLRSADFARMRLDAIERRRQAERPDRRSTRDRSTRRRRHLEAPPHTPDQAHIRYGTVLENKNKDNDRDEDSESDDAPAVLDEAWVIVAEHARPRDGFAYRWRNRRRPTGVAVAGWPTTLAGRRGSSPRRRGRR